MSNTQKQYWGLLLLALGVMFFLIVHYYMLGILYDAPNFGFRGGRTKFVLVNVSLALLLWVAIKNYLHLLLPPLKNPPLQESLLPLSSKGYWQDIVLLTLAVVAYHAFFWNKFSFIQEGWFHVYAGLIDQGKIPYRDFRLFLQPIYPYLVLTINHLFGSSLLVMREYGIVERVFITILLYLFCRRLANPPVAALSAFVAFIVYSGFNIDPTYGYYQTCVLCVMLSAYVVLMYCDALSHQHKRYSLLLLAGCLGGIAFMIKQTTGLLSPLCLLVVLLIVDWRNDGRPSARAFWYGVGFMLPVSFMAVSLYHAGAWHAYLAQVFWGAAASKGGLSTVLLGALRLSFEKLLGWLPILWVMSLWLMVRRDWLWKTDQHWLASRAVSGAFYIVILVAFIFCYYCQHYFTEPNVEHFFVWKENTVALIIDFNILLWVIALAATLSSHQARLPLQWFILASVSLSIIYSAGFSNNFNCTSLIMGMALFITFLLQWRSAFPLLKNAFVCALCLFLITGTLLQRMIWPYQWIGWEEPPITTAVETAELPALAGMVLSHRTNAMFQEITHIIQTTMHGNDTLYQFPHMSIFYVLADKLPATYSVIDYFDVCDDACALYSAQQILSAPPKIMVVENFAPAIWTIYEGYFRQGHPSGQRHIREAITTLTQTLHYEKKASYNVGHQSIDVWVRT